MKRLTLNLTFSLLVGFIPYLTAAQNHFTPAWSGNPYLAMNVYATQARYNSADLVSGDEIGIFDGTYCVGAKVLTGPIVSGSYLAMIASTQDGTTTTNGFTPGHTITYKFWKASSSIEIQTVTPTYSSGGPTFASLGSAVANLSAGTTSISESRDENPRAFDLMQNYPNPFNPSTAIKYALPVRSHVNLTVMNTLGQIVSIIVDGTQDPGSHLVRFDGSNLASGVYFYRIQAGDYVATKKLLLMK